MREAGLKPAATSWIDDGLAADIVFEGDLEAGRAALAPMQSEADICAQSGAHRRKKLLISDMDSTMITVECIDELADYAGIKPQIAEITECAMQGELDFQEALRARVQLLAGMDIALIDRCLTERVTMTPGGKALVGTMRGWGARTILVSGGFTQFAEVVADELGFEDVFANILETAGGKLSGTLVGSIVDASGKAERLEAMASKHKVGGENILAVGDGANDIPMIRAAIDGGGLGAAFHAKPKAADAANFAVRHSDLTALLYAQGIPRKEWAA